MRFYNWINEMMDDHIVDDSGNQWYIRPVGRVGTKKKGKSRRPKFWTIMKWDKSGWEIVDKDLKFNTKKKANEFLHSKDFEEWKRNK